MGLREIRIVLDSYLHATSSIHFILLARGSGLCPFQTLLDKADIVNFLDNRSGPLDPRTYDLTPSPKARYTFWAIVACRLYLIDQIDSFLVPF